MQSCQPAEDDSDDLLSLTLGRDGCIDGSISVLTTTVPISTSDEEDRACLACEKKAPPQH